MPVTRSDLAQLQAYAPGVAPLSLPCSTSIPQFAACKINSSGVVVICTTTDTDDDIDGVALLPCRNDSTISLGRSTDLPMAVLWDGSDTVSPGDLLTLSTATGGRFMKSTTTGIFRALSAAPATADSVIIVVSILAGSAGAGYGTLAQVYAQGSVAADQLLTIGPTDGGAVTFKSSPTGANTIMKCVGNPPNTLLQITNNAEQQILGAMADGASAVALAVDTSAAWANAGSKLLSIRNGGVEKAFFDYFGDLILPFSTAGVFASTGYTLGFQFISGTNSLDFSGTSLLPSADVTTSVGSSTKRWANTWSRRYFAKGTALVAGDFALSGGWGASASVGTISGDDSHTTFTVTSAGAGQAANPTIVLTFKDGTWTTAPFYIAKLVACSTAADMTVAIQQAVTATTLTLTFLGTPVASRTYTFTILTLGT